VVLLAMRDLDLACAADRAICRHRTVILERLRALETALADRGLEATGQHGDFRAENIFVGERRMDVTGFGQYRDGLALEDVARFFIDLELRFAVPVLRRQVEKLKTSFLDGYAQPVDADALRLFTITKALAMLAHDGIDSVRQRRLLRKIIIRSV